MSSGYCKEHEVYLCERCEAHEADRKTVVRLLQISNPDETIIGACNSHMQEVIALRVEVERRERWWKQEADKLKGHVPIFDAKVKQAEESGEFVDWMDILIPHIVELERAIEAIESILRI